MIDGMTNDELIETYNPLIWKNMSYFYGAEPEDLYQSGALGLFKAARNYIPNDTCKFSSYANFDIYGSMHEHVFKCKPFKLARRDLKIVKEAEKVAGTLAQKLGRIATKEEIAGFMGISIDAIEQAYATQYYVMSMDATQNTEDRNLYETIADPNQVSIDDRLFIDSTMQVLTDEERKIIELSYFQDCTQSEIGAHLNLSQVKVSRLKDKSLKKMREYAA